ncbi:AmiS/UreI family transporter [Actinomycetospora cinnamomea]|uniref:AmiS/UreI family transporter n=1 Tax=Actinomycetospora cinnamomea TaxID=663609 RepID=A0A2U1FQ36_9PSEU|nr:AmiS/UreI family transporter [Actinomycetospora cinnamomea]PVZ14269.1 AmiS/UreI family transporter [Actinomycetospora cinnamomea]
MAAVGLFYVGAVLFVNGLMLLGLVEPKATAIINLFVGSLQVITPTYLIFTANGDSNQVLLAAGLYLFGFTYLYVGIGLLAGLDTTGVGYFSLFVAIAAIGFSFANFTVLEDPPFGVIWLYWAVLWTLFFLLLGLKREFLTRYTGYVTTIQGWVTAAIPGFLLLIGAWPTTGLTAIVLGVIGVAMLLVLLPTLRTPRRRHEAGSTTGPTPTPVPDSELSRT